MCIDTGVSGGESLVANAVGAYNALVRTRPDLAAVLYEPLPYDFRGEQRDGGRPYYLVPAFTRHSGPTGDRLFVRYIRPFIQASQRHADAPRLTDVQVEAMDAYDALVNDADNQVEMALRPGDIQFVNNYHVLHGRRRYVDDADDRPRALAEAAVAGHRHPRARRPPRTLPTRRRHGPLGHAPHQGLMSDITIEPAARWLPSDLDGLRREADARGHQDRGSRDRSLGRRHAALRRAGRVAAGRRPATRRCGCRRRADLVSERRRSASSSTLLRVAGRRAATASPATSRHV